MKRRILILSSLFLLLAGILGTFFVQHRSPQAHAVGTYTDWTMFGGDLGHSGYNGAEGILNATTAPQLKLLWTAHGGVGISSQVSEANGLLYWGSWDGYEHATDLTGKQVWAVNLGTTSVATPCYPPTAGPSGSAAVASVPINGTMTSVVFVSGGDSQLYALNAATGAQVWNAPAQLGTSPSHMLWAGPIVYNGNVYVGVSSYGDCPLVQGQMFQINASTGAVLHTFSTVANGCGGGGIWDTPTIDTTTGILYVSTGTRTPQCATPETMAMALLAFHTTDLSLADMWSLPSPQGPGDSDFGSTPMLFQATIGGATRQMVGLVNKNGFYYAFDRTNLKAGPVWSKSIALANNAGGGNNFATSAWDGTRVYVAGTVATINGVQCLGNVRALDPATGNSIWEACLSNRVESSVMAVPGLVEVGAGAQIIALDSTTGKQVFTYSDRSAGSRFSSTGTIVNGVLYHGSRDGNLYAFGTGATPPPAGSPTATTQPPPPTTPPGPVSKTWYFAEGRVGSGFREYLTIDNPTKNACTANVKYLYTRDGSTTPNTKTVTVSVPATSRATQPVNTDLGVTDTTTPAATLSAVVTVDASTPSCTGFVVERPIYFTNYHGLSSGTNMIGSTTLGTTFNFADVPSGAGFTSYLTILNPGTATANVTVNYYAGGKVVGTQTLALAAASRGTITPSAIALPTHSAAVVSSNQPIMVERPTYITNVNGFSGAADVVGSQVLAKDWLFAEGYASATSQESLTIGNVNTQPATVTITLKSKTGATHPVNVTVPGQSQLIWNVNANNTFANSSPEVSAEVVSTGTAAISIVVQREMYYQYSHTLSNGALQTNSITDVMGMVSINQKSAYSFAEGYTNTHYHEWLTLQNPTANAETIYITIVNGAGKSYVQSVPVVANSRSTVDITLLVQQHLAQPGDIPGNEISMTVQTLNNGGTFVAERPIYFNTASTSYVVSGGTDVIGY